MKKTRFNLLAAGLCAAGLSTGVAQASAVTVTSDNMNGWSFVATDDGGALATSSPFTDDIGQMVTGPATPLLGIGSAQLHTSADGGNGASRISTAAFDGVSLSGLTSLSYATYDTDNNGQQFPFMEIAVSLDGSGSGASEDSLFFEPPYQTPSSGNPSLPDQGNAVQNQWQTWNVLTGGLWDNNGNFNPGAGPNGVGSIAAFLNLFPNATIMDNIANGAPGNEGITLLVGEDGNVVNNGFVDDVTVGTAAGTVTYDFEPSAVPEPATFSLGALGALGLFGVNRFRRKA